MNNLVIGNVYYTLKKHSEWGSGGSKGYRKWLGKDENTTHTGWTLGKITKEAAQATTTPYFGQYKIEVLKEPKIPTRTCLNPRA